MNVARRVPLAVWIILGVAAAHALLFWAVADKHYMPKVRYLPPPPPRINFGAAGSTTVDPQSGDVTTEQEFTVSTRLVTPPPRSATSSSKP